MLRASVVYNPISGRLRKQRWVKRAVKRLERAGWQVDMIASHSAAHVTELARQAAQAGQDAFFVAGGDGSINDAVAGLHGSETALGVLPAGTANVWARQFSLPGLAWTNLLALEQAAAAQTNRLVQRVDIGECNGRAFLMWTGIGIDAKVTSRMESDRSRIRYFPKLKYARYILEEASKWDGVDLKIEADGEMIEGRFVLAIVSNVRNYATAELSPDACLDDGKMDLWLFSGEKPVDTLRHVLNVVTSRHKNAPGVRLLSVSSVNMVASRQLYFHLDGDPLESAPQAIIKVCPRALRVLVPPDVPETLFSQPGEVLG